MVVFSSIRLQAAGWLAAILLFSFLGILPANGEGVFVAAPSRVDVAYDNARGVLYISNGGELLRYEVSSQSFLTPITLGGTLEGMDISPDGSSLVVADDSTSGGQVWVYIVSLATLTYQKVTFPAAFFEVGTFTAAYGNNGGILISSEFGGSGTVPLRWYDPATNTTTVVATVRQDTMLRASADHSVIALAESDSSDGPFDRYRVSDGNLLRDSGYANGTSWFNYEIAVRPDGQQYAIPTYGGTFFTDANLVKSPTMVGQYAAGQPIGVAYDPVKPRVYFPWAQSSKVYVYDSTTLSPLSSYDFESQFGLNGNFAFVNGRTKTSDDGSLLFVTVDGGVRYVTLNALAPTALMATAGTASVTLNWTASPNGTSYVVYQGTTPGGENATPVLSGITGTSATITGLTNGATYYFKVAAVTPYGLSTPTTEASATPIPPPQQVSNLAAYAGYGSVTLYWAVAPGAATYNVYQGTASGAETLVASGVTSPTYMTNAVTNGVTYYFRVAGVNSSGPGQLSSEVSATPVAPPAAPTALIATASNASVTLTWTASPFASNYTIYMSTRANAENTPVQVAISGTSATLTGLTNGTTYYFEIIASNISGQSGLSAEVSAEPMAAPLPTSGLTATAGDGQVTLAWQPTIGATSYSIYAGTTPGGESPTALVTGITGTSAVITGLTNGIAYYFVVVASNVGGSASASSETSASPLARLGAPQNLTASAGDGQVTLSWTTVSGASEYNIYQSTAAGAETATPTLVVVSGTDIAVPGLANGTTYFFEVSAVNASGAGTASTEMSATPEGASAGGSGQHSGGGALGWLSLLPLLGLTGRRLCRCAPGRQSSIQKERCA
jgi:fibronectin type 3 domain-containing protein